MLHCDSLEWLLLVRAFIKYIIIVVVVVIVVVIIIIIIIMIFISKILIILLQFPLSSTIIVLSKLCLINM